MAGRTLTLSDELVTRLEVLAQAQGVSVEVYLDALTRAQPPLPKTIGRGWALAVAEAMAANADITWQDEPEASTRSRDHYHNAVVQRWLETQQGEDETDEQRDS